MQDNFSRCLIILAGKFILFGPLKKEFEGSSDGIETKLANFLQFRNIFSVKVLNPAFQPLL
jgi:hypothetical protein